MKNPRLSSVVTEIEKAIAGKREVIERLLTAMLAEGHVLLDDVPGVGKTTLALALSRAAGLRFCRVQFTPDVMPSDLTGFTMVDRESGAFVYRPGALAGASLVLGDEINRASSKTQSALLEAMEERQVTVDGVTHPLEHPFMVIATQNRVGTAGTQPLPFAQMDRFMLRLSVGYPDYEAQLTLLRDRQNADPLGDVKQVLTAETFLDLQALARAVTAADAVLDYLTRLALASREDGRLEVGISPRGVLCLDRMAKALALTDGRDYVTGADVQAVFTDVCAHRVLPSPAARADGLTARAILEDLLRTVPNPDRRAK